MKFECKTIGGERLRIAAATLKAAAEQMNKVTDFIAEALDVLAEDVPEYDRVASVLHDMEDLTCDLKEVMKRCERGCGNETDSDLCAVRFGGCACGAEPDVQHET